MVGFCGVSLGDGFGKSFSLYDTVVDMPPRIIATLVPRLLNCQNRMVLCLPSIIVRFQISDFRFPIFDFRFPISDFNF